MPSAKNNKAEKIVHAHKQNYLTIFIMLSKIIPLVANSLVNQTWSKKYHKNLWNTLMQEILLKIKTQMKVILKTEMCQNKYFRIKMMKHFKTIMKLKTIIKILNFKIIISANLKHLENVIKKKLRIFRLKMEIIKKESIIKTY